jgi:hypothetical protein
LYVETRAETTEPQAFKGVVFFIVLILCSSVY